MEPLLFALLPLPVVFLVFLLLKGWKRYALSFLVTGFPTLLFYAYLLFEFIRQGFSIDFSARQNVGLGMGMVMIPAYNFFWLFPGLVGAGLGLIVLKMNETKILRQR